MPGLTDEQRLLRDTVRDLADEKIAPRAAEIDRTAEFPWDVKELLAAHDLFTLHFPERLGGLGGDLLTACLAIEQISRVCATSGLILAVQGLGALPILARRDRRAAAALDPGPRRRADAHRLRHHRGRGRLRRGGHPDARRARRRRLRHQRQQALHQPRLGGRPRHRLRR